MVREKQHYTSLLKKLTNAFETQKWKEVIVHGTNLRGKGIEFNECSLGITPITFYLGCSLYHLGYLSESIVLLGAALKLQSDIPNLDSSIAGLFKITVDDVTIIKYRRKVKWIQKFHKALGRGDWSKIVKYGTKLIYERIEFLDDTYIDTPIEYYVGYSLYRQANYLEAIDHLELAIILNPDSPTICSALADAFLEIGNDDKATGCYNKVLYNNPDSIKEFRALFLIRMLDEQYKSAASIAKVYFTVANKDDNEIDYDALLLFAAIACYKSGDIPRGNEYSQKIDSQTFRFYDDNVEDSRGLLLYVKDMGLSVGGSQQEVDKDDRINEILNKLAGIEDIISQPKDKVEERPSRPNWVPEDASWKDLRIKLVDPQNVLVHFKSRELHKLSFIDLGFGDNHIPLNPKPNKPWEAFKRFAENEGEISKDSSKFSSIIPMDISRIRTNLSNYFQIPGNPIITYRKKNEWRTLFLISDKDMRSGPQKLDRCLV